MSRTSIILTVAVVFVVAGIAAATFTQRPGSGGEEPASTTGQSVDQKIDPKSVGGPNDARQPPR